MSENYVKFKTNIEWYEMKTLIYLTLYECLVAFLQKIVDGKVTSDPIMSKEEAEEIGATYAKTHTTVPLGPDIAVANLGPALESLISEYNACEYDEYGAWFERASKVVPYLWD
jgi:hypothetical protein